MSLARALYHHAKNRPTQPAVVDSRSVCDYRELWARVAGLAGELARSGVVPGDLVALSLPASIEYVVALEAIALAGAVVLPIHPGWPAAHRSELIQFFAARAFLGSDPDPATEIHLAPELCAARRPSAPLPEPDWEAPLVVSNSSGTTGAYRGVLLRHRHMLARIEARAMSLGLSLFDRVLLAIEPHHAGSRNACFSALHVGATVILKSELGSAEQLADAVREEGATFSYMVPSMLRSLLALPVRGRVLLPSLRMLFSSSDRLTVEERRLIRERLTPNFYEGYAVSEGGLITLSSPEDQLRQAGSVGRPVVDVELEIAGDDDRRVPAGEQGHVRFRGPSVPDGYYRNPEATRERFRDGWFYPGDLASQNQEGFVFLKGRADDTIVCDGIKFLPSDVERVLVEYPSVREAAVVGVLQPTGSAIVVAFVCASAPLTPAEIASHAERRLPRARRPAHFELVDSLPVTDLGKVARSELKERARRLFAPSRG